VAGLSYAQAATVLDVPEGTVMSRLHRGRNRMRDALRVDGFPPRDSKGDCRMRLGRRLTAQDECHKIARLIQRYLDEEIDDQQAARVARHLKVCRDCGLAADTFQTIKAALARRRLTIDNDAVKRLTEFTERFAHS
jgi:Putative zinc-finger/Sigma-70, region 4